MEKSLQNVKPCLIRSYSFHKNFHFRRLTMRYEMVPSDRRSENDITNDSSSFSNFNIELTNVTEANIHLFKVWYQAKQSLKCR